MADSTGEAARSTGAIPGQLRQGVLIDHWLLFIELLTLAVILAIIGATYRSIGAPLIVLATATVGLLVTVWGLAQLESRFGLSVPQALDPVLIALLLGIITDYAVFFVSGTRTRLASGDASPVAARVTTAEFSPIILKSAVILGCGLLGLLVSRLTVFRDLGPALALTVGIAAVVSLTLVPALLATFGRLVFWPRSLPRASAAPVEPLTQPAPPRSFGRLLARRPVSAVMAVVCVAGLGIAAWQLQGLRVGFGQISDLPSTAPEHQASAAADRGFAPGILSPTTVLIRGANVAADRPSSLDALQRSIDRQPGVAATLGPADEPSPGRLGVFLTATGTAARIVVVFGDDPLGASGINDLRHLEAAMPSLAARADLRGVTISYAGDTALADQTIAAVRTDMFRVGLAVLLINLLLLVVCLRGVVAPLFLLASSVLTVAATLGLTSWVFQDLLHYGQLTYYVPFAVSVLLVSLGSDYNVFVVGRIWQEARLRPVREAVAVAAPRASRTIRVAGVALAASFTLLAIIPLRSFREIAFAMATGILLETFVVRALLVPALIVLFGRYNVWPSRRVVPARPLDPAPARAREGLKRLPTGYVRSKGGVE